MKESFIQFLKQIAPGMIAKGLVSYGPCKCGKGVVYGRQDEKGNKRKLKEYVSEYKNGYLVERWNGKFIETCEHCRKPEYDKQEKLVMLRNIARMREHEKKRAEAGISGGMVYNSEKTKIKKSLFGDMK